MTVIFPWIFFFRLWWSRRLPSANYYCKWAYMCTCRYKGFRTKRRGQNANVLRFHQISNLGFGVFGEWLIIYLAYQNGRICIAHFHIFPSLSCYSSRILGLSIAENVHLLTFQAIGSKNNQTISYLVGIMELTFA